MRTLLVVLAIMTLSTLVAQNQDVTIHITSKSDKIFGKDIDGNKAISFYLEGLNDELAVTRFTEKILKNDFVIDFDIIPATFNGKRKATVVFKPTVRTLYFQSLLQNLGVTKIVIDNQEIPVTGLVDWAEKKKEEKN
ncbi:MAG: hypothetical protein JXR58_10230 [Bacteroidales bacterium]|nr:hypothetical protein [Bacteroidales bacterium]